MFRTRLSCIILGIVATLFWIVAPLFAIILLIGLFRDTFRTVTYLLYLGIGAILAVIITQFRDMSRTTLSCVLFSGTTLIAVAAIENELSSIISKGPTNTGGVFVRPIVPEPGQGEPENKSKRKRKPKLSVNSLEKPDESPFAIQNWDAVLTLAQLSSKVYDDSRVDFAKTTLGFEFAEPVDRGDRHSLVCSNSNGKIAVIAFRGSLEWSDFELDSEVHFTQIGEPNDGYSIHSGFHKACIQLYDGIVSELRKQKALKKMIIVTGHSLGGAMAVAFAYQSKINDDLDIQSIVTFGQPLIANEPFAGKLLSMFEGRHRRFVHRDDIFSRVPRPSYFHSGSRILLVEHLPPQIWFPALMSQNAFNGAIPAEASRLLRDSANPPISDSEYDQFKSIIKSQPWLLDGQQKQLKPDQTPKHQVGQEEAPVAAAGFNILPQMFDDHFMNHYIKCIEEQDVSEE